LEHALTNIDPTDIAARIANHIIHLPHITRDCSPTGAVAKFALPVFGPAAELFSHPQPRPRQIRKRFRAVKRRLAAPIPPKKISDGLNITPPFPVR
jgi:hypothetical protein